MSPITWLRVLAVVAAFSWDWLSFPTSLVRQRKVRLHLPFASLSNVDSSVCYPKVDSWF